MKRIAAFSMTPGGLFIDLEDSECAVTVTPNEGDVLLHEGRGAGRLNGVRIPGAKVECFEADRLDGGFGIRLWFQSVSGRTSRDLGMTGETTQAIAWADAANAIYTRERQKADAASEQFRLGRFRSNPTIHDILEEQINTVLPGPYLFSKDASPPVFPETWSDFKHSFPFNAFYVDSAINRLRNYARSDLPIENRVLSPPRHDYSWFAGRVRYRAEQFESRVTQPLELIFDREQRRSDIGVIKLGTVRHFAILYWKNRYPAQRLSLCSREQAANTYSDWVDCIHQTDREEKRLVVLAHNFQSVDYSLQDAISKRRLDDTQRQVAPTAAMLAKWLWSDMNSSIVACDIGVAFQVMHSLTAMGIESGYVDFALVPYERPISIGPCYRVDDPEWGAICNDALTDALESSDALVQEDLATIQSRASQIGIEWGSKPSFSHQ